MDAPTPDQLLELAARRYNGAGRHEQAMRDELDLSAVEFWRRVLVVVTDPSPEVALRWGPTIARLRRRLDAGVRARNSRRAG